MFKLETRKVIILALTQDIALTYAQQNHLTLMYYYDLDVYRDMLATGFHTGMDTVIWITKGMLLSPTLITFQLFADMYDIPMVNINEYDDCNLLQASETIQ